MATAKETALGAPTAIGTGLWFLIVVQVLRLGLAMTRALQVDELQILHLAWLRSAGERPGIDYAFPQSSLLLDLLEPMWRALGPSLAGIFVARGFLWLVSVGVVGVTGLYAGRLFGAATGVGAALALSIVSEFNEQAFEVRADPFLALFSVGSLLLISRGSRLALAGGGFCIAAMIAFSFKALLFAPFAFLAVVLSPRGDRGWRGVVERLFRVTAGLAVGLLAYFGFLTLRGDLALFFATITRNIGVSMSTAGFNPLRWVYVSFKGNWLFYLLSVAGLIVVLRRALGTTTREYGVALLYAGAYVAANPTFFPYNLVDVTPVVAVAAGAGLAILAQWKAAQLITVVLMAFLPLYRAASLTIGQPLRPQLEANRIVMAMTSPTDRVYDASGIILFRRGPFQWRMHSLMHGRYMRGEFRVADEIMKRPVRLILPSYRTQWLAPSDQEFLQRAFVMYRKKIAVAGARILPDEWRGGRTRFLLVVGGEYSIHRPGGTALRIDGVPVRATMQLMRGWHELEAATPPRQPIVIVWSAAKVELLDRFPSPRQLLYLW